MSTGKRTCNGTLKLYVAFRIIYNIHFIMMEMLYRQTRNYCMHIENL